MIRSIRQQVYVLGPRGVFGVTLGLLAGLLQSVAEVCVGLYLQAFLVALGLVDRSLLHPSLAWAADLDPRQASLTLAALGFLRSVGAFVSIQVGTWTSEVIGGRIRSIALYDLLYPAPGTLAPNSEAQHRMNDMAVRTTMFCASVGNMLNFGLQGTLFFGLMLASAWRESVVTVVGVALVAMTMRASQGFLKAVAARLPPHQRAWNTALERVLRNRIFVTLLRMEGVEEENLLVSLHNVQRLQLRNVTAVNSVNAFIPFMGITLVAAVVWSSQVMFHTGGLTLLSFLYLMLRFVQTGQSFTVAGAQALTMYPHYTAAVEFAAPHSPEVMARVNRYNQRLPFLGGAHPVAPSLTNLKGPRTGAPRPPSLDLKGVTFSYGADAPPVLRDFSLSIERGQQLALVGPSGVGKSTLLLLMLGVLRPGRGEVLLDGAPAETWRQAGNPRIGYVGAEPFLIMGTLAENLSYGLFEPPPLQRMLDALRFARLEQFASAEALQRMVGEDLQGLSAGQKQRLCLARAWLSEPDLLILDEATANVDEATETLIADTLRGLKGQCTTVLVTHRRGLLVHADRVVDMGAMHQAAQQTA